MNRKILLSLSLLTAGACLAAPLTPEEALSRLDNGLTPGTRSAISVKPSLTLTTKVGDPALYVFENYGNNGFMVVSADDAITPLLGYSDTNSFDPSNIPPALQGWLDQYSEQIEYVRSNNVSQSIGSTTNIKLPTSWTSVGPLLKTTWNQGAPYNDKCPQQNGVNTYTGCVATSMAQVMNYFQYPEKGQGSIEYICYSLSRNLKLDFSTVTFDWANMLDSYSGQSTAAQKEAVATLMMAAGYSVQMSYSTNQSGAVSGYIPGALYKYFNYDSSVTYVSRNQKTYTEWATLIYNNLKNIGPVIYDGDTASAGGHSFVCDGYSSDGYFHFNWGWGGAGDGYFLLDSLNPSVIGIGGAAGGFNFRQDAVFNIQKPKAGSPAPQDQVVLSGSIEGYTSSSFMYFKIYGNQYPGFRYYGDESMTFDVGAKIENTTNNQVNYVVSNNSSIYKERFMPIDPGTILYTSGETGYPYPMFLSSGLGLTDGVRYKITAAYRPENGDWIEASPSVGCYNYFYVTKNGTKYTFENFPQMQLTCNDLSLASDLYDGVAVKLNIKLSNPNNIELTRGVTVQLLDNKGVLYFQGDSYIESVAPGSSVSRTWTTALAKQVNTNINRATQLYFALYDIDTQTRYYTSETPVTMQPNPGVPQYECDIKIDNANFNATAGIYEVTDPSNIEVTANVDVARGIFSYPVSIYVMEPYTSSQYRPVLTLPLNLTIINAGESVPFKTVASFPGADSGIIYALGVIVNNSNQLACEPASFVVMNAGVGELAVENEIVMFYDHVLGRLIAKGGSEGLASLEAYSINGMRLSPAVTVNGDSTEMDLSTLGKGVILVKATDNKGKSKTIKLAL